MAYKRVSFTPDLEQYVAQCHSLSEDPILQELEAATAALGDVARMQISPEQGSFLAILLAAVGARAPVEVGTFTGYSALCLARALPEGGKLLCFDASEEWTRMAKEAWEKAGVASRIELRLGDARETIAALPEEPQFDFAFIDADKTGYDAYYELLLPRLRPNSLILFDNMLWGGRLADRPIDNPDGQAIDALNRKLARDPRVESVLLPLADGVHLCRKK